MRRALITGVTGQDGLFLSELLLSRGYRVFGLVRSESQSARRLAREVPEVRPVVGDLRDLASLIRAFETVDPDEVYNLAATSFVGSSWELAELNAEVTALGALRVLEAFRIHSERTGRPMRLYQASSSEMFGNPRESPQDEDTPFHPRSPYGVAKVFAHNMAVNYRESYGLFICCGILYNHESERRGYEFVTRKVTRGAARIAAGLQDEINLGALDSRRDWGFAGDYVEAMRHMLSRDQPDDYVIATGVTHSVADLLDLAFSHVSISDWRPYVRQDPLLLRPSDGSLLVGNARKARLALGWQPSVGFDQLIGRMMDHDVRIAERAAADLAR